MSASMDATGILLDAHAAKCAAMQASLHARERALIAGVPLLTIGLVGELTPEQRQALFACWQPAVTPMLKPDGWRDA